jgi:Sugar (and other) transporter
MSTLLAVFFNIFINPIALGAIQWKYYFVFIVVLVLMLVTVYFYYPETRGRSLEQIAYLFDGDDAAAPAVSQTVERAHSVSGEKRASVHVEQSRDLET